MSSIIDALKKSDKNRTNESSASLDQIKFGNQPVKKSRRGFWLLLLLLVVVSAAAFAWSQGWQNKPVTLVKSWFATAQSDPVEPVTKSSDKHLLAESSNKLDQQNNGTTNNKLTPPKPDEVKAKKRAVEQVQTANNNENNQQLEVIASRNTNGGSKQSPEVDAADNEIKASKSSNKKEQQMSITDDNAKNTAQQNRRDLEPAIKQDYLLVHQIDFEIRKNIPPVKLNIHIFDPDPENRMVILNGVKYATGDSIEDLVTVEEINQQGVVLEFEGIKFLIPK